MPRLTNIKVVIACLHSIASNKCLTEEDELDVETLVDLQLFADVARVG